MGLIPFLSVSFRLLDSGASDLSIVQDLFHCVDHVTFVQHRSDIHTVVLVDQCHVLSQIPTRKIPRHYLQVLIGSRQDKQTPVAGRDLPIGGIRRWIMLGRLEDILDRHKTIPVRVLFEQSQLHQDCVSIVTVPHIDFLGAIPCTIRTLLGIVRYSAPQFTIL